MEVYYYTLYIKDTIRSSPLSVLTNAEFQDSIWCKLDSPQNSLVVGVCYRSTASSRENNTKLLGLLDKAAYVAAKSHLLIFGDFNYPEIDYASSTVIGGSGTDAHAFLSKTNDLFLYQHINDWTRHRIGQQPSLLDYVFTDEDNVIDDVQFSAPLGKSDHVGIKLNYIRGQQVNEESCAKYNYWKGDYADIKKELQNIDWAKQF